MLQPVDRKGTLMRAINPLDVEQTVERAWLSRQCAHESLYNAMRNGKINGFQGIHRRLNICTCIFSLISLAYTQHMLSRLSVQKPFRELLHPLRFFRVAATC